MGKRTSFIIIILILIFIILIFYTRRNKAFNDIMIFNLWEDLGEQKYIIDPKKEDKMQIDVFKTIENGTKLHKKIAPGNYGKFDIKLIKPINSNCEIIVKDITNKPQNLIFLLDGKKYNTIEEMQKNLSEKLQTKNKVTIHWKWNYDSGEEKDIQDTEDGEKAERYIFEIKAIVEK